jgi:hypothetical protein
MSKRRPPAYDLSTEKAIKHLFPREADEAVWLETKQEGKPAAKAERTVNAGAEQRDASEQQLREARSGQHGHG